MLNFNSVMLNTGDVQKLAEFYEKVFDRKPDMQEGGYYGWQVGSCFFNVAEHSEVKGSTNQADRILFNFESNDVKKEFERISKVEGIVVVKEPYTMEGYPDFWIATLADPDGNYFQLMTPWDDGSN